MQTSEVYKNCIHSEEDKQIIFTFLNSSEVQKVLSVVKENGILGFDWMKVSAFVNGSMFNPCKF